MYANDVELGRALTAVAPYIDWPPEPALAPRVRAHLEAVPVPAPLSVWERLRPRLAQPAFLAAAAAVVASVILIASPAARDAVANFLGLDGVRVEFVDRLPRDVGTRLRLGEGVTMEEAQERAGFEVLVPSTDELDDPDRIFFDPTIGEGQVALVYAPREGLPETPSQGVGMLIMQFEASIDDQYYKKLITNNVVEEGIVGADWGFWVEGDHVLQYREADGTVGSSPARLVGNTLVWQHGDVTFRLESSLSKDDAISIAGSMHRP